MSLEKRLKAIPAQSFTANGTTDGVITLVDACQFKVKQQVFLSATSLPNLDQIEVKRVLSDTQLAVGPKGGNIDSRIDISAYTVMLGATIAANEQLRPSIPFEELQRAVYEEEPTVATRVIMVDKCGDKYGPDNPLPIAFGGTIAVGNVTIQDDDGNELEINTDGSINVNVTATAASPGLDYTYNSVSAVASGVETTLLTMIAPGAAGMKFYKIDVSGENIALFRVKINTVVKFTKRTFFGGDLNESFAFEPFSNGLKLNPGDILTVTVLHNRPSLANYEVTALSLNL